MHGHMLRFHLHRLRFLCLMALWVACLGADAAASTRTDIAVSDVLGAPVPGWILVSAWQQNSVLALNPHTLATERSFPLGLDENHGIAPGRLALGADGTTLYVVTGNFADLAIISLTSGDTRYLTLRDNGVPMGLRQVVELAPGRVLVLTSDGKPPAEIDIDSGTVLHRLVGPGGGQSMALDRDRQRLFVDSYNVITRIDLNGVEAPFSRPADPSFGFALSPDGQSLSRAGQLLSAETLSPLDRPVFNGHGTSDWGAFGGGDGRLYLPQYRGGTSPAVGVMSLSPLATAGQIVANCARDFDFGNRLVDGPDGASLVAWEDHGLCVFAKTVVPLAQPRNYPGGGIADVLVDHARVLATVPTRNEVVVLRRDSLTVLRRLAVPGSPTRLVLAADGRRVFVTLAAGSGIAVIDLATLGVEAQRYPMPDGASGFTDAALMADGRLLALAAPAAGLGVIEDAPGHALRWLELPAQARPDSLVFDARRAYAYFLSDDGSYALSRLELADLDHVTLSRFSALRNGRPFLRVSSFTQGVPVMTLSADGARIATQEGVVFNPLTLALVHDFKRPSIATFGKDSNTYLVSRYDIDRNLHLLERHALPSGKLLGSSLLKCEPAERLRYVPAWDDVIGFNGDELCTRRAITLFDTKPIKPREVIPLPNLLQPLSVGTRLKFTQARRPIVLTMRRPPAGRVPREAVQIQQFPAPVPNETEVQYEGSTASAYRLYGGKETRDEESIEYLLAPAAEMLNARDAPRGRVDSKGTVRLRNQIGQTGLAEYEFRRNLRGYEQVRVPAGSFRALRVDYVLHMFLKRVNFDETRVWTVWYVPGLGEVKELHRGRPAYGLAALPAADPDGDGVPFKRDNCPLLRAKNIEDFDRDRAGDPCDADDDADGIDDWLDNCPRRANANQRDLDFDAIGDACQVQG